MDVHMPEMDGLEATKQICQQWSQSERPRIIAMTATQCRVIRKSVWQPAWMITSASPYSCRKLQRALEQASELRARDKRITPASARHTESASRGKIDKTVLNNLRDLQADDEQDLIPRLIDIYLDDSRTANDRNSQGHLPTETRERLNTQLIL